MFLDNVDIYLKYERLGKTKSKTRFDLIRHSGRYEPCMVKGKTWIYLTGAKHIKATQKRKPDITITGGSGNHITSVFIPDTKRPELAYGDIKGTTDAALFLIGKNSLEIFIAKGKKNAVLGLYQLLADGELASEIDILRSIAGLINSLDEIEDNFDDFFPNFKW